MPGREAGRARGRHSSGGYVVRASELGSYEYCHRAWWLREIAGVAPPPATQTRLDRGHRQHAAHGRAVSLAPALLRGGLLLLVLAGLLLALWLALSTFG